MASPAGGTRPPPSIQNPQSKTPSSCLEPEEHEEAGGSHQGEGDVVVPRQLLVGEAGIDLVRLRENETFFFDSRGDPDVFPSFSGGLKGGQASIYGQDHFSLFPAIMQFELACILDGKGGGNLVAPGCSNQVINSIKINSWELVEDQRSLEAVFLIDHSRQCGGIKG